MDRPQVVDRARLGLNRLSIRLVGWQAVCAATTAPLYPLLGLSFAWRSAIPFLVWDAAIFLLWLYHYRVPGKPGEWIIAETIFAFLLVLTLSNILGPAQYLAVAFGRPLIDPFLARADATLGVHVPALAGWTRQHPWMNVLLTSSYAALLWQFAVAVPVLGIFLKDRRALWEYVANFHFCAIVTVAALAVIPAECAFQH